MSLTFGIIKPDAVAAGNAGKVLALIEANGFKLRAVRMTKMAKDEAEGFYAVHQGKPFFEGLVEFMTSGPCILLCLEKENAFAEWRKLMGATNPANAEEGTIRKMFAESIGKNAAHGSDSEENAAIELAWFFRAYELA